MYKKSVSPVFDLNRFPRSRIEPGRAGPGLAKSTHPPVVKALWAVAAMVILLIGGPQEVRAGGSVQHSSKALEHLLNAMAHSSVASMQLVFGATAIPLGVSAEMGKVSGEMSDVLWDAANAPVGEPLPIADEAIMIGPPPAQALDHGDGQ